MINSVFTFLRDELNSYIAARTGIVPAGGAGVQVRLTRLVDENGRYAFADDSLALSMIALDEERTFRAQVPSRSYVDGQHVVNQPELQLNMHALVAANFRQYDEALKYLALVMTFFQAHFVFTRQSHPGLNAGIEKLTVELQSLGYEQLNQIWAFVGAKQLPSAVYRVRVAVLQDREPVSVGPPILTISSAVSAQ
jgi:hypothetical protein